MWTTELTLKLIEDLQINVCLWDVTSVDYRNHEKRAKTICELAQKYDVVSSEIEKKIHTLKSQFTREHKKLVEARKSDASPKKCAWFGYEHLLFLLPANESRGSRSTDEEKEQNSETPEDVQSELLHAEKEPSQSEAGCNASNFQAPTGRPKTAKRADDFTIEAVQCVKNISQVVTKRDSFTIFGDFVADSLRTCNRPNMEIVLAKKYITDIRFNLQSGSYHANDERYTTNINQNESPFSAYNSDTFTSPQTDTSSSSSDHDLRSPSSDNNSCPEYNLLSYVSNFKGT